MTEHYKPESEKELLEIISELVSKSIPTEITGCGSKRGLGNPENTEKTIFTEKMNKITNYDPTELILTCGPGTRLTKINQLLKTNNQYLAFEPPDYGPLYGFSKDSGTIGGVISCNLSGARRFKVGAARDHFLGFRAISGRANIFKSGGNVVKNVSGYDLCKLISGSFGTLGVMSQITIKVLPAPIETKTMVVYGLDTMDSTNIISSLASSILEVSGLAFIPKGVYNHSKLDIFNKGKSITVIRMEGPKTSVAWKINEASKLISNNLMVEIINQKDSKELWNAISSASPFSDKESATNKSILWKISLPPNNSLKTTETLTNKYGGKWFLDGAAGTIWYAPDMENKDHDIRKELTAGEGGYATLVRAPDSFKTSIPVFHPQSDSIKLISKNIKERFDPFGILNPNKIN